MAENNPLQPIQIGQLPPILLLPIPVQTINPEQVVLLVDPLLYVTARDIVIAIQSTIQQQTLPPEEALKKLKQEIEKYAKAPKSEFNNPRIFNIKDWLKDGKTVKENKNGVPDDSGD